MLKHLIAEDGITCDERDRIIQRIAADNGFPEHTLSILAGYQHSKAVVLEKAAHMKPSETLCTKGDENYTLLTEFVRAHSEDVPGYVIQSWLRSGRTLVFLNLWETENNSDYCEDGYKKLLEKKKTTSLTLTPKLWISQTNAAGILSRQGKSGGTFARPMIACKFASWLAPDFKMMLLNLSLSNEKLK